MIQAKLTMRGISGIVLCGGESKRMGTDKGLIMKDSLPWFLHIGNLIESLGLPVYYSIRTEQLDSYKTYVDEESLVIDDTISEGPLRGVLSVMKSTNSDALLVIACDMQVSSTPSYRTTDGCL